MQMIYNSPNYCVVEFPPQEGLLAMKSGGYEIVDKNLQREIYIDGAMAARFREHVQKLIEEERDVYAVPPLWPKDSRAKPQTTTSIFGVNHCPRSVVVFANCGAGFACHDEGVGRQSESCDAVHSDEVGVNRGSRGGVVFAN